MKRIITIFIILLSVSPSYSIYTGKVTLNIRTLKEEIEKKVEKTEGVLTEKISDEIEEKPEVQPAEIMTAELPAQALTAFSEAPANGVEEKTETVPPGEDKAKPVDKPEAIASAIPVEETGNRVAVFPFENFSDNKDALKYVMPVLISHLGKKGVEVVDEASLSDYLCNKRIRSTGYVSRELARKIKDKFKVKAILVGSIISFSTGKNPEFGILARLINPSDGGILWADYASATGEDFTGILGLGRLSAVHSLIPRVMDTLFTSFYLKTLQRETGHSYRIAVMPFQNNTDFRNAGMIATYMFMVELLKNPEFEPIEYGNIRNLIVSLRIRNRGGLDYENMNVLSEKLGAGGILVGVVDNFTQGAAASSAPKVAVSARLLDGGNNKILWYNSRQLSGEENIIAFDWGRIRSVHIVAYRVVSSLVKNMGLRQWR